MSILVQTKAPDALIVQTDGEIINIYFVCVRCKRVSIFTNSFVKSPKSDTRTMQCGNCGYSEFFIKGQAET